MSMQTVVALIHNMATYLFPQPFVLLPPLVQQQILNINGLETNVMILTTEFTRLIRLSVHKLQILVLTALTAVTAHTTTTSDTAHNRSLVALTAQFTTQVLTKLVTPAKFTTAAA